MIITYLGPERFSKLLKRPFAQLKLKKKCKLLVGEHVEAYLGQVTT